MIVAAPDDLLAQLCEVAIEYGALVYGKHFAYVSHDRSSNGTHFRVCRLLEERCLVPMIERPQLGKLARSQLHARKKQPDHLVYVHNATPARWKQLVAPDHFIPTT
jgi:hypothetical protein